MKKETKEKFSDMNLQSLCEKTLRRYRAEADEMAKFANKLRDKK